LDVDPFQLDLDAINVDQPVHTDRLLFDSALIVAEGFAPSLNR
jgi:hypothetical protein